MFLALLLMAAMSGSEGKYKGLACYKCDYIMSFCTFRCRHQPSVAHSYYCNDFCDRRNERCYLECVEDRYGHASWGPKLIVEWRHNARSRTEHDVGVLSVIHVIKSPHVDSLCVSFKPSSLLSGTPYKVTTIKMGGLIGTIQWFIKWIWIIMGISNFQMSELLHIETYIKVKGKALF